jgi:hypothetical protein
MAGQTFLEFKADIAANGQKNAITLNADGILLDGRNRLRACQELGITPITETRNEPDEIAYIISMNIQRRQMDKAQAAAIAAELANLEKHSNQYQKKVDAQNCASIPPISQTEAAERLGVSRRSVQSAQKTLLNDKELHQAAKTQGLAGVRAVKKARQAQQPPSPPRGGDIPDGTAYSPQTAASIIKFLKFINGIIALEGPGAKTDSLITPQDMAVIKPLLVIFNTFIEDQEHVHANHRNHRAVPETPGAKLH